MVARPAPSVLDTLYAVHGTERVVCPKCVGGSEGEKSFSMRVDEAGNLHARCFRASCGYSHGPRGVRSVFAERTAEPRYFTRPTQELTQEQDLLICQKFGINADILDGYTVPDDRFVLGVYGPIGFNKRGVISYSLSGAKPKSLTYNEKPGEPFVHYAGNHTADDIVVVEDWFSAEKVATTELGVGVAIMGTHLSQAIVDELADYARKLRARTWLAFDKDAYAKSLNYLFKYREQFPGGLFAWRLEQDLKYETTERITEALIDGKTNFSRNAGDKEHV